MSALEIGKEIKAVKKSKLLVVAGILLIVVAVINVLFRINPSMMGWAIDGTISVIIFVSGVVLLKFDKRRFVGAFGFAGAVIGILYSILKLYVYKSVFLPIWELTLPPEEASTWFRIGLASFIPTIIISIIAAILILRWKISKPT
ncbi:MAG: hypothetical protein AB1485_00315 [Candidatus Thermoplasmatota archaeon]